MPDDPFEVHMVPLDTLHEDPNNFRVHPDGNIAQIRESIAELGVGRSTLTDGQGVMVAGSGTLRAAREQGITQALVVKTRGDVLIVHQRDDLTEAQRTRLAILDNHTTDLSYWDDAGLGASLQEDPALFRGIFDAHELDHFKIVAARAAGRAGLREDMGGRVEAAEELRATWGTEVGQVWRIPSATVPDGEHRLVIGDARNQAVVDSLFRGHAGARCVITDPPYGVNLAARNVAQNLIGKGNRVQTDIVGDRDPPQVVEDRIRTVLQRLDPWTVPGASCYITGPTGDLIIRFLAAWEGSPFRVHQTLVWVKHHFALSQSDYQNRHELIYYGWKTNAGHYWDGSRHRDTVLELPKPQVSALHPSTKPVELYEALLEPSTQPGETLVDPFAGSGTALVAAEQQGRLALMAELDPGYGAVTLQRAADLGLAPQRA